MEKTLMEWNRRWKELIESKKLTILLETDEQTNSFLLNTSFRLLKSEEKDLRSDDAFHYWKITDRIPTKWVDSRGENISDYLWGVEQEQTSYLVIIDLFSAFLLNDKLIRALYDEITYRIMFNDIFYLVLDKTKK